MGFFDFLFGKPKNDLTAHSSQMSHEEMKQMQEGLKDKMDADTYNSSFNQACRLIPSGKYAEAIALFTAVKEKSPDHAGDCDNQIGVCHFFLGDFETAIQFYKSSIAGGFDSDMADDNIWEACDELISKTGDKKKWGEHYLSLLPEGNHKKSALKAINA